LLLAAPDLAKGWLQVTRIELTVFTDNAPAIHLYQRFAFRKEGTMRNYAWRNGEFADVEAMAWLRDD
jgi:putative acetyltransferase